MEEEFDKNVLLYPIGFDLSRLDIILQYGIMCEEEYQKNNLDFIKNIVDSSSPDSFLLYRYDDLINNELDKKSTIYIENSICIVIKNIDNTLQQNKIEKENIVGIIIPNDESLLNIEYFGIGKLSAEELKSNCKKILKFIKKYGYLEDKEKYENSFEVLEYSFKYANEENNDDFEDARNYLNVDIGYDVEDTFKLILRSENISLYDVINYLNKKSINVPIVMCDLYKKRKKSRV